MEREKTNDLLSSVSDKTPKKRPYLPEEEDTSEFVPLTIRLRENDKILLKRYFSCRGLGLSTGVRTVLYDFMVEKDLK